MNNLRFAFAKLRFAIIIVCLLLVNEIHAQEKNWIGVMITQATLNGADITSDYMGKKGIRIFKYKDAIQLWIFETFGEEYKTISSGKLDLINHDIFQTEIKLDIYTANWCFDSFLGEKDGSAQIQLMSDKERSPKYPSEMPKELKGFNLRIKTSTKELSLIGLYAVPNYNDLEDILE